MLNPGSVFAGYQVERILGRGGMGDVYLARHPRLPRSDALKLMSEELSRNEVYRQRFSSEADIACQVQHDSVVRVYDRGEDNGRLWLAMEYIDGRDLADVLAAEGRLPLDRAVSLLERIAAGLDAIHARGLLHRDVKPANILVTRDVLGTERALLTDFGIARSAADSLGLTGVGDIVATLHYAAPEQFELRSGELDRRVDVYALGCVLYEMLTGRVPLKGDSVAGFWHVMQTETPPPPSREVAGIPPRVDAVLAKALSKRREDRFASAGELARAAREAITAAQVYAPPVPPIDQTTVAYNPPPAGPFRLSLRRADLNRPGGGQLFGPVDTTRLAPTQSARLSWMISASDFFNLQTPPIVDPNGSLTIEMPGRVHTVGWRQPPAQLLDLVREVERLSGGPAQPHPPAPYPPSPPGPAPSKRKRGKLLAALGGLGVVIAAAVVLTIVLMGGSKPVPGVPGEVTVKAGRGTVTVEWRAGDGKTDHYVIYRDGKAIAPSVSGPPFTDRPNDTATHRYAVQAVNQAGRTSAQTPVKSVAAQVRLLNTSELALLAKLPKSLIDPVSCKPFPAGVTPNLDRSVICDPSGNQPTPTAPGKVPQVVQVYGAPTAAKLKAALLDETNKHAAKAGSCAQAPQQGTWNFTETPKVIEGQIICYTTPPTAYLLWSYDTSQFFVKISTTNSYASLLKYWQGASIRLP